MQTIWKYTLPESDAFKLMIPERGRCLTVQVQNGDAQLWVQVDDKADSEVRWFYVVGTGHPIPEEAKQYVGTWQQGPYVWHLYAEERG